MMPACTRGPGVNIGMPDVCLTPAAPVPVPVPYPNFAIHAQAASFVIKLKIRCLNALNLMSKIAMTSGMEAGSAHPTIKGAGAFTMGSPKVFLEGAPAVNLTNPTTGNNMNNAAGVAAVPDPSHVFYGFAGALERPTARRSVVVSAEERRAFERRLERPTARVAKMPEGTWYLQPGPFAPGLGALLQGLVATGAPVIVDLRGNPGGTLEGLAEALAYLLPAQAETFRFVGSDGQRTSLRGSGTDAPMRALVALVDGDTASCAELFAGALRAHGRCLVIGTPTRGKATVQTFSSRGDGASSLYLEVGRCQLPGGVELPLSGLEPDHSTPRARAGEAFVAARRLATLIGRERR